MMAKFKFTFASRNDAEEIKNILDKIYNADMLSVYHSTINRRTVKRLEKALKVN